MRKREPGRCAGLFAALVSRRVIRRVPAGLMARRTALLLSEPRLLASVRRRAGKLPLVKAAHCGGLLPNLFVVGIASGAFIAWMMVLYAL